MLMFWLLAIYSAAAALFLVWGLVGGLRRRRAMERIRKSHRTETIPLPRHSEAETTESTSRATWWSALGWQSLRRNSSAQWGVLVATLSFAILMLAGLFPKLAVLPLFALPSMFLCWLFTFLASARRGRWDRLIANPEDPVALPDVARPAKPRTESRVRYAQPAQPKFQEGWYKELKLSPKREPQPETQPPTAEAESDDPSADRTRRSDIQFEPADRRSFHLRRWQWGLIALLLLAILANVLLVLSMDVEQFHKYKGIMGAAVVVCVILVVMIPFAEAWRDRWTNRWSNKSDDDAATFELPRRPGRPFKPRREPRARKAEPYKKGY